jgi:hypothetical protein
LVKTDTWSCRQEERDERRLARGCHAQPLVRIAHFFIDRPIFAAAVSVIISLLGAIAYPSLAVDQYPKIAPPTVTISASYPGASAEVMADNVAAPLEQQINGVAVHRRGTGRHYRHLQTRHRR